MRLSILEVKCRFAWNLKDETDKRLIYEALEAWQLNRWRLTIRSDTILGRRAAPEVDEADKDVERLALGAHISIAGIEDEALKDDFELIWVSVASDDALKAIGDELRDESHVALSELAPFDGVVCARNLAIEEREDACHQRTKELLENRSDVGLGGLSVAAPELRQSRLTLYFVEMSPKNDRKSQSSGELTSPRRELSKFGM